MTMQLIHEIVVHAEEIGTGIAVVLTAVALTVVPLWLKIQKESRKWKALYDVSVAGILKAVKLQIVTAVDRADPSKVHTLGLQFDGGIWLAIPVIIGVSYCPWPGLMLTGLRSNKKTTYYSLETTQPTALVRHQHDGFEEHVTVEDGSMTDLDTGKIYRPGESWIISPGVPHRVYFEAHGLFICRLSPALPLSRDQPVNVDRLHELEDLT